MDTGPSGPSTDTVPCSRVSEFWSGLFSSSGVRVRGRMDPGFPGRTSPPPPAPAYRRMQGEAAARPSWSVGFEAAVVGLRVAKGPLHSPHCPPAVRSFSARGPQMIP